MTGEIRTVLGNVQGLLDPAADHEVATPSASRVALGTTPDLTAPACSSE